MELQQLESWVDANKEPLWWTVAALVATLIGTGLFFLTRHLWNRWAAPRANAQEDAWWTGYREGERKGASQAAADLTRLTRDLNAARSDAQASKLDADKRYAVAEALEDKALHVAQEAGADAQGRVKAIEAKLGQANEELSRLQRESGNLGGEHGRLKESAEQLVRKYRDLKAAYAKIAECPHPKTFAAFNRQYRGDGPRSYLKFGDYCTSCGFVLGESDPQLVPPQPVEDRDDLEGFSDHDEQPDEEAEPFA